MNKILDFPNLDLGDSRSTHNTRAHSRPGDLPPDRKRHRAATINDPGIRPDSALLLRIAVRQAVSRRNAMITTADNAGSPPEVDMAVRDSLVLLAEHGCPDCQLLLQWLGAKRMSATARSMEIDHD